MCNYFNSKIWFLVTVVLLLIAGVLLLCLAVILVVNNNVLQRATPSSFKIGLPFITVVIAGVLMFVVTWFGFNGALKVNISALRLFMLVAAFLIIIEITCLAWSTISANSDGTKQHVEEHIKNIFLKNRNQTVRKRLSLKKSTNVKENDECRFADTTVIDSIQYQFSCCGTENSTYWIIKNESYIPDSCFPKRNRRLPQHEEGCYDGVRYFYILWALATSIILGIAMLLEIAGMTLAFRLWSGILNGEHEEEYYDSSSNDEDDPNGISSKRIPNISSISYTMYQM
ncbi:CD151 antigen-like [Anthonomus grandis grandis]|uniref:CD151 antigen-like n=1 Tax=Anthonomus grandis grandis TaxID=2921223 RepID=UPI002166592F|nr:CD151 antigen-like [Anthonomus grandis grandis]